MLFESGMLYVTKDDSQKIYSFSVDLSGITLLGGQEYAWILDCYGMNSGGYSSVSTAYDSSASYADGMAFSIIGPFPPGSTREDHFTMSKFISPDKDWAFTLEIDPVLKGDINMDAVVDLKDIIIALQCMVEIQSNSTISKEADVNGDGKIGLQEVIYVLQELAGIWNCIQCDADRNGEVTANDIIEIYYLSLKDAWTLAELCVADVDRDGMISSNDQSICEFSPFPPPMGGPQ